MLPALHSAHQPTVSDAPAPDNRPSLRFARVVAGIAADAASAAEQRKELRALVKSLRKRAASLGTRDGALLDGDAALQSDHEPDQLAMSLLAARLQAYGVERLELSSSATEADLFDLVKLLATTPDQPDPEAFFAARAAAVDARAVPRKLRSKPAAPPVGTGGGDAQDAAAGAVDATPTVAPAIVESASVPEPKSHDSADPRSERLKESLPIPETSDQELQQLFATLQSADAVEALRQPLERLTFLADLAFRTGKFDKLVEALTGLLAIEHEHLARDASDDRRREFARAVRRLATPVILRQIAMLRHIRADDATAAQRLQAMLYRYGTDGAEALIDEWTAAPTAEARAACLDALRGLRRTHDALFEQLRHVDERRVRQAIELLAALGDARAEQLLLEQLRHPEARTRRAVMAALERFPSVAAFDALGLGLLDAEPLVRLRAVAALQRRGPDAVKLLAPLLDAEPDLEVLYAAIAALGVIGGADAVQVLIRAANGETQHPRRRSAAYRLQACAALAQIRTPQAMAAVQLLRDDRDREVREGSMRLVAQAARRGSSASRATAAE